VNYLTEARARRLAAAAALLVSGALVTGCGSASGGPANPGPGNQQPGNQGAANPTPAASTLASCSSYPGAKSCYLITVTAAGARAFHGTDTVPNSTACPDVLAGKAGTNAGEVQLSAPVFLTGPVAAFDVYLDRYHGPGVYSTASQDASVMFLIGSSEYSDSGAGSAVSARAGADGSVSVVFTKLASSATPNATITGQAQFTCRNA